MDDSTSGFLVPVPEYTNPAKSTLTLLHTSESGFFALYRGERAGRFRVFKCLKPEYRRSTIHQAMLQKEFEIGYSLSHPGICQTVAYLEVPELGHCIEMEWIDGETLEDYLGRGLPDRQEFLRLAGELCDAVDYLHKRQILHRDIKPSNIMITYEGASVKLIDFSLADRSSSSVFKFPAGTRYYTAPEVIEGNPGTVLSDIYSLGAVLAHMVSGRNKVAARCMQKNPRFRYSSAAEVKKALLTRRSGAWIAALVVAVAVAAAVLASFLFLRRPAPVPAPEAVSHSDTVYVITPEAAKPRPEKPRAREQKTEDPDRIFREATELLEGLR